MSSEQKGGIFGWVRRLYDWVLAWADTPYAMPALFLLAFAGVFLFSNPSRRTTHRHGRRRPHPGLPFCVGLHGRFGTRRHGWLRIGLYGWEAIGQPVVEAYHGQEVMVNTGMVSRVWVLGHAHSRDHPIPYKIFTISSGVFQFPFLPFVGASIIGRAFRFCWWPYSSGNSDHPSKTGSRNASTWPSQCSPFC